LYIYGFALSYFIHGVVSFLKLAEFTKRVSKQFDGTIIAGWPSISFAYSIPFLECIAAILIVLPEKNLNIKGAQLGVITISLIMVGTCLIEKWNLLSSKNFTYISISVYCFYSR